MPFNQKDYEIGLENENKTKPQLESYFGCKLNEQDRFNTFDYISQDKSIYIELKCRNNTHSKYPTTMVGMNKIIKGYDLINMKKSVKFCFKFTDGLYYYELKDNKNNGHFKYHHDFSTIYENNDIYYRALVYIFYLNDVDEGGETILWNDYKIKPKAGSLLFFPASWTYPHKGNVPISHDKYIVTGWLYAKI